MAAHRPDAVRTSGRRTSGEEFRTVGRAPARLQITGRVEGHIVKNLQNRIEKFGDSDFLATFAFAITKHAMRK